MLTKVDKKEGDKGVKERKSIMTTVPKNDYFYFTKNDYNMYVTYTRGRGINRYCTAAEKEYRKSEYSIIWTAHLLQFFS